MQPPSGPSSPPLIEWRQVTKTYREGNTPRAVLDAVDLTIEQGEQVVLLGRSGSGKSTVLNLLSGIDLASSGEMRFEGLDLGALSERRRALLRRQRIGFIFQAFNLLPTLTVEENILLPLELAGRPTPEQRRHALDLLAEVGLAERRRSFPDVLSGGEQQRLAIARALAHEPDLVLADEPTGNLDHDTAERVLDLLRRTVQTAGKTLVMATHSHDVARLAHRVLRVGGGHLHEASVP